MLLFSSQSSFALRYYSLVNMPRIRQVIESSGSDPESEVESRGPSENGASDSASTPEDLVFPENKQVKRRLYIFLVVGFMCVNNT